MKKLDLAIVIGSVGFLGFYVGAFTQEWYRQKMKKQSMRDNLLILDQVRKNRPDLYEDVLKELEV